jgi:hypothetical protein
MRKPAPRSKGATGPKELPFDLFIEAAQAAGWELVARKPIEASRATKPAVILLRRGKARLSWVLYAWYATLEGFTRQKDDYRVQTTRARDTEPLLQLPSHQTVGIGWDTDRQVFFGFDGWAERLKGTSTSVHIQRATLERTKTARVCVQGPRHDVRFAFGPEKVDDFITWVRSLADPTSRDAAIIPDDIQVAGSTAVIVADVQKRHAASWLRVGDRIVVVDNAGEVADAKLWKIDMITAMRKQTAQQNAWRLLEFRCRHTGNINLPLPPAILEPLR